MQKRNSKDLSSLQVLDVAVDSRSAPLSCAVRSIESRIAADHIAGRRASVAMHYHEDKASSYIARLDSARIDAKWSDLPELIRKVTKHAPQRKVLTETANVEYQTSLYASRPSTASALTSEAITALSTTLQTQHSQSAEDVLQARACLLWAQWVGSNTQEVSTAAQQYQRSLLDKPASIWSKICMIRSAYILATSDCRKGEITNARNTLNTAMAIIQRDRDVVISTPQLSYWSEQSLGLLATDALKDLDNSAENTQRRLDILRTWSMVIGKTSETNSSSYKNTLAHIPRLTIWRAYYTCLSSTLQFSHREGKIGTGQSRLQQSAELRKVERAYESALLQIHKFPKATESNKHIERWVESVIRNWQVTCGSQWQDEDLGEGGRNAAARNVLDVLYRAASKTFHSTLILRRLFQVHKYLAEFDLAYKAFDTYINLVDRERSKALKSDTPHPQHEPIDTVLTTIADAIHGLCIWGHQTEARKAHDLCIKLEDWLEGYNVEEQSGQDGTGTIENGHIEITDVDAPEWASTLESVYRAIGVGKACWAKWTPFNEHRSKLQQEALDSLKKACSSRGSQQVDPQTLYLTAILLAETRQTTEAITYVKRALASITKENTGISPWANERRSIPMWHLLALLLSARGDFEDAAKSCAAAFEQFPSVSALFGTGHQAASIATIPDEKRPSVDGIVRNIGCEELQQFIQIQITELALTELSEGPEEALNSSNDLLGLFSRVFPSLQTSLDQSAAAHSFIPPKSAAGTVKTTRNSMFSRHAYASSTRQGAEKMHDNRSMISTATRPSTRATQAPTIQITDEQGKSPEHKPRQHGPRKSIERSIKRLTHHKSHAEKERSRSNVTYTPNGNTNSAISMAAEKEETEETIVPLEHEKSSDSQQPLSEPQHNLAPTEAIPPPASHSDKPPQQDVRLPTISRVSNSTTPLPQFPDAAVKRHAYTILTSIWLVIATLYRRASMFEDSKEACEEAAKAVTKIESLVNAEDQSARALASAGWGSGKKSVDELWADVCCERGELQLAMYQHRLQDNREVNSQDLRDAADQFEQCLMYYPDHSKGVIGLSNLLLDYYEKKVDLSRRIDDGQPAGTDKEGSKVERPGFDRNMSTLSNGRISGIRHHHSNSDPNDKSDEDLRKTPENLNRISARDRAYGLLSTLTKLGSGWDNSEAWFALARAYELGGEVDKAKSILWWCIELEDSKPIRHWSTLTYNI